MRKSPVVTNIWQPAIVINIWRQPALKAQAIREQRFVNIMRPSRWGNPFPIPHTSANAQAARAESIRRFEAWIVEQPWLEDALVELRGKVLGCCCAPKLCHGHVLAKLVNAQAVSPVR